MAFDNPIVIALMDGRMDDAQKLLAAGEPIDERYFKNNQGRIFLNLVNRQALELTEALVEKEYIVLDLYELDRFQSSFYQALADGTRDDEKSLAFLRAILDKTANKNDVIDGHTLIEHFLEGRAHPAAIRALIDAGCDAQYRDNAERNYIRRVVDDRLGKEELRLAYLTIFADAGIPVDAKDIVGVTPLLMAVKDHQQVAIVEWLLQHGANPNETDKDGENAFHEAIHTQNKNAYDLLKQYGAPNFDLATKNGEHMLTRLLQAYDTGSETWRALLLELLADGADMYQTSPYYGSPKSGVDWLAEKKADVLKAVLATGAIDVTRQDDHGNTILHKVCAVNPNYEEEVAKETYRKVKLLLEAGADPAVTNDKDETALMLAQNDNLNTKTVELLLAAKNAK